MKGTQAEAVRPSCRQKNRMNNLMKKLAELITLCGTEGFILYSSSSGLKSWPEDPIAILRLILHFRCLQQQGIRIRRRKVLVKKSARSELISHEDNKSILVWILRSMYGHDKLDCLTVQQLTEVMDLIQHLQTDLEEKEREEISSVKKRSQLLDLLGKGKRDSGGSMKEGGEKAEKKSCLFMKGEEIDTLEVRDEVANGSSLDERRWKEIEDMKARGEEVELSLRKEDINSMKLVAKFVCKAGEERMEGSSMEERPPNLDLSLNFNH